MIKTKSVRESIYDFFLYMLLVKHTFIHYSCMVMLHMTKTPSRKGVEDARVNTRCQC